MLKKKWSIFLKILLWLAFFCVLVVGGNFLLHPGIFVARPTSTFFFLCLLFSAFIMGISLHKNEKTTIFLLGFFPIFLLAMIILSEFYEKDITFYALFLLCLDLIGQLFFWRKKWCMVVVVCSIPLFIYMIPFYLCESQNSIKNIVSFHWDWKTGKCITSDLLEEEIR